MTSLQRSVLIHLAHDGELSRQGLSQRTRRRVTISVLNPLVIEGFIRREGISWSWYSITAKGIAFVRGGVATETA